EIVENRILLGHRGRRLERTERAAQRKLTVRARSPAAHVAVGKAHAGALLRRRDLDDAREARDGTRLVVGVVRSISELVARAQSPAPDRARLRQRALVVVTGDDVDGIGD